MVDVDWFLTQAEDQIIPVDNAFARSDEPDEMLIRLHLFAAWATWRIILTLRKAGMPLSDEQDQRFTYLKFKFVQYSHYLPKETSDLSI